MKDIDDDFLYGTEPQHNSDDDSKPIWAIVGMIIAILIFINLR